MENESERSHGALFGYLLWWFGFLGAHRFYYGRRITGTIWFFTLGLLGVGWILDLFLMPRLARSASRHYYDGPYRYEVGWLLLTFLGLFGAHRLYTGRILTGLLWMFTGGLLGAGVLYDFWTLNEQISQANQEWKARGASFS